MVSYHTNKQCLPYFVVPTFNHIRITLSHEPKFQTFMSWAKCPTGSVLMPPGTAPGVVNIMLSIQVVKQVNFGPLESKRYFVQCIDGDDKFIEVIEQWLIDVNIEKLNMFKNYKCNMHNQFFEIKVYQKDPVNAHR